MKPDDIDVVVMFFMVCSAAGTLLILKIAISLSEIRDELRWIRDGKKSGE